MAQKLTLLFYKTRFWGQADRRETGKWRKLASQSFGVGRSFRSSWLSLVTLWQLGFESQPQLGRTVISWTSDIWRTNSKPHLRVEPTSAEDSSQLYEVRSDSDGHQIRVFPRVGLPGSTMGGPLSTQVLAQLYFSARGGIVINSTLMVVNNNTNEKYFESRE